MNDGSVTVKIDGKKLEEIGEAMRAATSEAVTELVKAGPSAVAPEAPQGDGLKAPRAVGATEGEAAPVAPTLASLAAASKEPAGKPRKGASKKSRGA